MSNLKKQNIQESYFLDTVLDVIYSQKLQDIIIYKGNNSLAYKNIIISTSQIGHTSLYNTTNKQVLDSITDFYILTNSQIIYAASHSGFSLMASKFNNIKLIS